MNRKEQLGYLGIALAAAAAALVTQGCSHATVEKRLDERLNQTGEVKSRDELQSEAGQLIEKAPGLSADQKARLTELRDSMHRQTDDYRDQSLKLRAVLIKDVISSDYNEDEVELIKKRLHELEDRRLTSIFDAVDKANSILGREAEVNQKLINDFFIQRPKPGIRGDD